MHTFGSKKLSIKNMVLLFLTITLGFAGVITLAQVTITSDMNNARQTIARITITELGLETDPLIDISSSTGIYISGGWLANGGTKYNKKLLGLSGNKVVEVWVDDLSGGTIGGVGGTDDDRTINAPDIYTTYNTGKVGIGTNILTGKLTLASSGDTQIYIEEQNPERAVNINLANTTRTRAIGSFGENNGDMFYLGVGGLFLFTVKSGGNIGIGTITPQEKLEVSGGNIRINNLTNKVVLGTDTNGTIKGSTSGDVYNYISGYIAGGTISAAGADTQIQYNSGGALGANNKFVWLGGKLGVGVSNPNNTIQVSGLINFPNGGLSTYIGKQAGYNSTDISPNTAIGMQALYTNTTGRRNTAIGMYALSANIFGNSNTAVGYVSLQNNTIGFYNTAIGSNAMANNTNGSRNTAVGQQALQSNTAGNGNVAIGNLSLGGNTVGSNNIGIGTYTLSTNTAGNRNIAIGQSALAGNTVGNGNVAIGQNSLSLNTLGTYNIAIGEDSLQKNINGLFNTAIGQGALQQNSDGGDNIALGLNTLNSNTHGVSNVAIGSRSLGVNINGSSNTSIGLEALSSNISGNNNTAIGNQAGYMTEGNGNIFIGYKAGYSETGNNRLHIGNGTNTTLIYGEFDNNKVGIHTTAPTSTMDISGDLRIRDITEDSGLTGVLVVNASGKVFKVDKSTIGGVGGTTPPAGSHTQIQYNSGGTAFGANANFVWSGGRLGVGLSNPNNTIQVTGLINFDDAKFSTFLGYQAGTSNIGNGNTALGFYALNANYNGNNNIGIGDAALIYNTDGNDNIAIGKFTLLNNTTGNNNTAIGTHALYDNIVGDSNTSIGYWSLMSNVDGSQNTAIGEYAGYSSQGSGNVFLGYNAGFNEIGNNRLHIANNSGKTLIYGEFDNNRVGINTTGVTSTLDINGDLRIRNITEDSGLTGMLVVNALGKVFKVDKSTLGGGGSPDNLGNHIATTNLDMKTFGILHLGTGVGLETCTTTQSGSIKFVNKCFQGCDGTYRVNLGGTCAGGSTERCGNAIVESGEQCDLGSGNNGIGKACDTSCQWGTPSCTFGFTPTTGDIPLLVTFSGASQSRAIYTLNLGNGLNITNLTGFSGLQYTYQTVGAFIPSILAMNKYDMSKQAVCSNAGITTITVNKYCGNAIVESGEQCDLGSGNNGIGKACDVSCQWGTPSCTFGFTPTTGDVPLLVTFSGTSQSRAIYTLNFGNGSSLGNLTGFSGQQYIYQTLGAFTPSVLAMNKYDMSKQAACSSPLITTITINNDCGNTIVESGEQCDLGLGNNGTGKACSISCQWVTPPACSFSMTPTTGYIPFNVTFSGASTGRVVYTLNFDNGYRINNQPAFSGATTTYTTPGTYHPTLVAKNQYNLNIMTGCAIVGTASIEAIIAPKYCGDGIVQTPNDSGAYEQCDLGSGTNSSTGMCGIDCTYNIPDCSISASPSIFIGTGGESTLTGTISPRANYIVRTTLSDGTQTTDIHPEFKLQTGFTITGEYTTGTYTITLLSSDGPGVSCSTTIQVYPEDYACGEKTNKSDLTSLDEFSPLLCAPGYKAMNFTGHTDTIKNVIGKATIHAAVIFTSSEFESFFNYTYIDTGKNMVLYSGSEYIKHVRIFGLVRYTILLPEQGYKYRTRTCNDIISNERASKCYAHKKLNGTCAYDMNLDNSISAKNITAEQLADATANSGKLLKCSLFEPFIDDAESFVNYKFTRGLPGKNIRGQEACVIQQWGTTEQNLYYLHRTCPGYNYGEPSESCDSVLQTGQGLESCAALLSGFYGMIGDTGGLTRH